MTTCPKCGADHDHQVDRCLFCDYVRCADQWTWTRRRTRGASARIGRVMRCIKEQGHDGPHAHEQMPDTSTALPLTPGTAKALARDLPDAEDVTRKLAELDAKNAEMIATMPRRRR